MTKKTFRLCYNLTLLTILIFLLLGVTVSVLIIRINISMPIVIYSLKIALLYRENYMMKFNKKNELIKVN